MVLGASLQHIFNLITMNFVKLVLIATFIASPLAWYLMDTWLQDFEYRTEITWNVFLVAGAISMLIAVLTISYQAISAALASPVKNLKTE